MRCTSIISHHCFVSCCSSASFQMFCRSFQDRRFGETGTAVGRVQELPNDELWQNVAFDTSVLQERNNSQDCDITETRLSVLSVLFVTHTPRKLLSTIWSTNGSTAPHDVFAWPVSTFIFVHRLSTSLGVCPLSTFMKSRLSLLAWKPQVNCVVAVWSSSFTTNHRVRYR